MEGEKMNHNIRKTARQAAQAIAVGILPMDQVKLMREVGAFLGRAETQAQGRKALPGPS